VIAGGEPLGGATRTTTLTTLSRTSWHPPHLRWLTLLVTTATAADQNSSVEAAPAKGGLSGDDVELYMYLTLKQH
jgi:hypothetical protein